MGQNELTLVVEIKNNNPVELEAFANSLKSLGDEYKRFCLAHEESPGDVGLYIKSVRSGSIIAELMTLAASTMPLITYAGTIYDFGSFLAEAFDFLAGKSDNLKAKFDKNTLMNLSNIVEPIVSDKGAQINLSGANVQGDVIINQNITHTEANAVQNKARRMMDSIHEPVTGIHEQVVMYWSQAKNDPHSTGAGDKAKIESIWRNPVKVLFADDSLKSQVLFDVEHPFTKGYVVDVVVETVNEKPVLYKVFALHEIIELDG